MSTIHRALVCVRFRVSHDFGDSRQQPEQLVLS